MTAKRRNGTLSDRLQQFRAFARRTGSFYLDTGRTYRAWWPRFLLLAALIFIPVNVATGLVEHGLETVGEDQDLQIVTLFFGLLTVTFSSLLGEVLLAGTIALSLAGSLHGRTPGLDEIARGLKYGRLVLLDLAYVVLTALGTLLLLIPGLLVFTLLALAGPVTEIEHHGIRGAFRRSARLVRSDFWLVFWVLFPISVISDLISEAVARISSGLIGHGTVATGVAESVPEILLAPFFAVAAVLLTLRLIDRTNRTRAEIPVQPGPG